MSQSQNRDLYHLGILEFLLGAGIFMGTLLSLPLRDISHPLWDKLGSTVIFITGILGFAFVLFNYVFEFKTVWNRSRLIRVISIGALAFGCVVAIFCTGIDAKSSFHFYLLVSGAAFLLSGYGVIANCKWSNIFQQVFCFFFGAAVFFVAFLAWGTASKIFTFICLLIALPSAYLIFVLQDMEFRKPLRIGLRVFFFTLLFIWLSILIIGIPNFINAEQRRRQRITMGHLRSVANAVEGYAMDHNSYPPTQSIHDLARLLEPRYIKELPLTDGWEFTIEYYGIMFGKNWFQGYVIRSPGRDGKFEYKYPTSYRDGPVHGFQRDIVFSIGSMSQWPEGDMSP
jgi:competence protein ComGC